MHWSKQSGCGCQCALGELVRVIKEEGENVCVLCLLVQVRDPG